jgi:tape measure domain-containing protein
VPDRTLAEAIAEIRLSDRKFAGDISALRTRLLAAAHQLESDIAVTVGFRVDEDQVIGEFAKLEQFAVDFAPTAKLKLDSDAALADLAALAGIADPIVVPVNTDKAAADLTALSNIVIDPSVVVNTTKVEADLSSLAANPPPIIPDVVLSKGAEDRVAARLASLKPTIGLTVDPAPAISTGDRVKDRLDALRAQLHLDADPTKAKEAIGDVGREAEAQLPESFARAGEEAGNRFAAGIKKTASTIASTIGIAAGGFIAGVLVTGFDRLNTIEDATASLTVQLHDAKKAADLLETVHLMIEGTPFHLDQFSKAAANMVTFGIEAGKIPRYLQAIGEASASQGGRAQETAQRLAIIFGQIANLGRVTGEDLLQFSEAGVNALTILGNHFGKTTDEMRTMISSGAVPAKEALDALSEGIINGTKGIAGTTVAFDGTMKKLGSTLTGSMGAFKSSVAKFGVELIKPVQDIIIAGFQGAIKVVDGFAKSARVSLSGIGDAGFGKSLRDSLKDLPSLVAEVSGGLSKLGPAVAPLIGFLGASGLGSLKEILGSFGKFIPALNPITAAFAAFVVFTPQIRDELVPVLVKLLKIVGEAGAVASVAAGKIGDALVPVFVKLAHVADSLVPMVDNVLKFGEGLLAIVVPAISLFAAAIDHIPVGVIVALVTAFGAFKLLSHDFDFLERGAYQTGKVLEKFGVDADVAAGRGVKAMHGLEMGVAGAFAGMALSSENGATQITGAIGSISAIAIGFATGGPWGGAAATLGVAVGAIAGFFVEGARKAHELKVEIDTLSKSFADATFAIINDADALKQWNLEAEAGITTVLGQTILADKKFGDLITNALVGLNLPASGKAGGQQIIKLFGEINKAGGDMSKVPEFVDALSTAFGKQEPLIGRIVDHYDSVGKMLEAIHGIQQDIENGTLRDTTGMDAKAKATQADLVAAAKLFGDTPITPDQEAQLKFIFDIKKAQGTLGDDKTLAKELSGQLDVNAAKDEGYRIAIRIAEQQLKLNHATASFSDVQKIQLNADKQMETNRLGLLQDQIREALILNGIGKEAGVDAGKAADSMQARADELGVSILDMGKGVTDFLGGQEADFRKIEKQVKDGTVPALEDIPPPLDQAAQAAKNLADAILLSKGAADAVSAEIDRLKAKLDDRSAAQNFAAALRGVVTTLSTVTNEADIKQGEQLNKSIADQRDKITGLQTDVQREFDAADVKRRSLADQLEVARKLGDANGIALITAELAHVDDKRLAKQADLDKANADLDDFTAKLNALGSLVPKTVLDVLTAQSKFAGMSMADFLLAAPTPEAIAEWQGQLVPLFQGATDEFVKAATADPANAVAIAKTYRDQLIAALVNDKGFDTATATKLVDASFDPTKLAPDITRAAAATALQYKADLQKAFSDDATLGVLAKEIMNAPLQSDTGRLAAAKTREALQAEFDKHNLEIGVAPRTLTDADVAALSGFVVEAVVPLKAIDVTSAAVAMTTQSVVIQVGAGGVTTQSKQVTSGSTVAHLGALGPGGTRVAIHEGGVFSESHLAAIVAAGAYRVFAEPETYGEGYVPLSPFKRTRSLGIMGEIADLFGYQLEPKAKAKMVLPGAFGGAGGNAPVIDADAIGRAVARHTASQAAARLADGYDHAVHVESGAIVIQGDRGPKRTAVRIVSSLAELALKRR